MTAEAITDRQKSSIVAIGSFNPSIFHPIWFAKHSLIRDAEAENANLNVMSAEVSVVRFEWFTLEVTADRFALETSDPRKFQPLKDLALGTFEILEHTPIRAFGFNSIQLFQIDSIDAWHQFGHHFAPKKSWMGIIDSPGLKRMTILGQRDGRSLRPIQISIDAAPNNGVLVSVNEHYNVPEGGEHDAPSSVFFTKTLDQEWNRFLEYSAKVGSHLIAEGGDVQ